MFPDPAVEDVAARTEFLESSFYYRSNSSSAIMRLAHFPDGVLPLLQMEILAAKEAATTFACSMIVEFGCYDGRALEAARFTGIPYLGIDTDQRAILQLQQRIKEEQLNGLASATVGDALDTGLWRESLLGSRPLYLLPFNLLGNFRDCRRLLSSLSKVGGMAMFSVFNSSPMTNQIRSDYYARCGIRDLRCTKIKDHGVLFTGADDFYSRSFDDEALKSIIKDTGALVLFSTRNCVGQCVTVLLNGDSEQKWAGMS